jgi:hypothetical protein
MTPLIMSCLTILGMLVLTTFPVLVPAIITAGHLIRRRISARLADRAQDRLALDAAY